MFDRLSIRTKLIAIVAAPLVVILALASLGFTQRRVEAAETRGDVARLDTIETALDLRRSSSKLSRACPSSRRRASAAAPS